ncbi:amidohydrolase [Dethiosulfatibacter aminovorans DSM 17477]|uniref:Peptidase M20 domain-containing protein 2 n=1 Tax=Dethiosulfatibacter aminovorans DSM 17477 TaxID=1121476 RepID=A0A1M6KAH0_9FIRM|nr:M20 family metallopeptidase [Dethiosulfatibacter aminovorans]SHJ55903.1 amidohydrolase [Dethiosulfatibacter aminovorans DSM 17477]
MIDNITNITEGISGELIEMSEKILNRPELGNEEFFACSLHIEILKKHGFNVDEKYLGIETGFRASYDSEKEGPTIAYLAEYDALPGIGHGCGHNLLGAVSTGAGIVLKKVMDDIGGKVVVFGTPAEETCGAKVVFADKGAFNDIDIVMIAHPSNAYSKSGKSLAMEALQFEFRGKSAHAASSPEKGINALDAVINTFNNINALRQQIRSDARIHGIIPEGGKAANIIPDHCVAKFYVRAKSKTYLNELVEKVKKCALGASMAAGTTVEISNYEYSYDNLVTNEILSDIFTDNLKKAGVDVILDSEESLGSVDAGNVSHKCPTIHAYFDITNDRGIIGHTVEFRDSTKTEYAYDNMKKTIEALVLTAVKVIEDEELLGKIKEEFEGAEK